MGLLDGLLKPSGGSSLLRSSADILMAYESKVENINNLEHGIEKLSDDELRQDEQGVAVRWTAMPLSNAFVDILGTEKNALIVAVA